MLHHGWDRHPCSQLLILKIFHRKYVSIHLNFRSILTMESMEGMELRKILMGAAHSMLSMSSMVK